MMDVYQQAKERDRVAEEQRLWLDYHGIPNGEPRNRHERRKASKLLQQLDKRGWNGRR